MTGSQKGIVIFDEKNSDILSSQIKFSRTNFMKILQRFPVDKIAIGTSEESTFSEICYAYWRNDWNEWSTLAVKEGVNDIERKRK